MAPKKPLEHPPSDPSSEEGVILPDPNARETVWNEKDEIIILHGMLARRERGVSTFADLGGFLDSIKNSVHTTNVNTKQLSGKMKRLQEKFQRFYKRGKDGLNPHDLKCYELMKVVFAGKEVKRSAAAENGKRNRSSKHPKQNISPNQEIRDGSLSILDAAFRESLPKSFLERGLALLGDSEIKELENRWRKVELAEAEVSLKRIDLVQEQTAMVLGAIKSHDEEEQQRQKLQKH